MGTATVPLAALVVEPGGRVDLGRGRLVLAATRGNGVTGAINGTGAIVETITAGVATVDSPATITEANTIFTATDNLHVEATGGVNDALGKVIVRCTAGDAQAVTVA